MARCTWRSPAAHPWRVARSPSLARRQQIVGRFSGEGEAVLPFMTHLNQVGQPGSTPRHQKGLSTCCHGEEPHVSVGVSSPNAAPSISIPTRLVPRQSRRVYVSRRLRVVRELKPAAGIAAVARAVQPECVGSHLDISCGCGWLAEDRRQRPAALTKKGARTGCYGLLLAAVWPGAFRSAVRCHRYSYSSRCRRPPAVAGAGSAAQARPVGSSLESTLCGYATWASLPLDVVEFRRVDHVLVLGLQLCLDSCCAALIRSSFIGRS